MSVDIREAAIQVVANIPVKFLDGEPIQMMFDREEAELVVDALLEHGLLS